MKHAPPAMLCLAVICAACLGLVGCSQEGTPYTEQTAAIDPALNPSTTPSGRDMPDQDDTQADPASAQQKVTRTDAEWRAILSDQEYNILRQSGTEYAFTGRYLDNKDKGAYHCAGCGNKLYGADHKFHSGCGWPSFYQAVEPDAITEYRDTSAGMLRVEMRCAKCDGHLGHIFPDAPDQPTGMRHCVNGNALIFVPAGKDPQDVIRAHREKNASR